MINLIPNEEKKKMFVDFYLRLLNVVFYMLGIAFVVASLSILPSFMSVYFGNKILNDHMTIQKEEVISIEDQNALLEVKELQDKISIIEDTQVNKYLISDNIINEIIFKKPSNIKITNIAYKNSTTRGRMVSINGTAPNRESLLLFRKSFEENPAFKEVDLPISNFVKGSNIKFFLILIPS